MTGPEQERPPADLRVVSRNVTDEDIAAVTAVLQGALDELAAANGLDSAPVVSAWQLSQRSMRSTLTPGPGAWRGFSA